MPVRLRSGKRTGASEAISHEILFEAASLGKPVFAYLDPSSGVGFVYFANSINRLSILSRVLNRLFPARHPMLDWLEDEQAG